MSALVEPDYSAKPRKNSASNNKNIQIVKNTPDRLNKSSEIMKNDNSYNEDIQKSQAKITSPAKTTSNKSKNHYNHQYQDEVIILSNSASSHQEYTPVARKDLSNEKLSQKNANLRATTPKKTSEIQKNKITLNKRPNSAPNSSKPISFNERSYQENSLKCFFCGKTNNPQQLCELHKICYGCKNLKEITKKSKAKCSNCEKVLRSSNSEEEKHEKNIKMMNNMKNEVPFQVQNFFLHNNSSPNASEPLKIEKNDEYSSDNLSSPIYQKIIKSGAIKRKAQSNKINKYYKPKDTSESKTYGPCKLTSDHHTSKFKQSDICNENTCFSCQSFLGTNKIKLSTCKVHSYCNKCSITPENINYIQQQCKNCFKDFNPEFKKLKNLRYQSVPPYQFSDLDSISEKNQLENHSNEIEGISQKLWTNENSCILLPLSEILPEENNYPENHAPSMIASENLQNYEIILEDPNENQDFTQNQEFLVKMQTNNLNSLSLNAVENHLILTTSNSEIQDTPGIKNDLVPFSESAENNYHQKHCLNSLLPVKRLSSEETILIGDLTAKCIFCERADEVRSFLCNHNICEICLTYYCCLSIYYFFNQYKSNPSATEQNFSYFCPLSGCAMKISVPTIMVIQNFKKFIIRQDISENFLFFEQIIRDAELWIPYFDGLAYHQIC